MLACFTDAKEFKIACTTKFSNIPTFKEFDPAHIEADIKRQRTDELHRTIRVEQLQKSLKKEDLERVFGRYGVITRIVINSREKLNHAFVVYENAKSVVELKRIWSLFILKDAVKITPADLTEKELSDRSAYCLKLTGLPLYTYAKDLEPLLGKYKGKTCSIPRRNMDNLPYQHAYINFESEDDLIEATKAAEIEYNGRRLYWNHPTARTCHNCGNPDHVARQCKFQRTEYPRPLLIRDDDQDISRGPISRTFNARNSYVDGNKSYANAVRPTPPAPQKLDRKLQTHLKKINDLLSEMFNELVIVKTDVNIVSRCIKDLNDRQLKVEQHLKIIPIEDERVDSSPYIELNIPLSNNENTVACQSDGIKDNSTDLIDLDTVKEPDALKQTQGHIKSRLSIIERELQAVKKLADVFGSNWDSYDNNNDDQVDETLPTQSPQ